MVSFIKAVSPQVLNSHISVLTAASYSGYSTQYLRRLLRTSKLTGALRSVMSGSINTFTRTNGPVVPCGRIYAVRRSVVSVRETRSQGKDPQPKEYRRVTGDC